MVSSSAEHSPSGPQNGAKRSAAAKRGADPNPRFPLGGREGEKPPAGVWGDCVALALLIAGRARCFF